MEKELYMPPCCIDKKLPKLLRDNAGRLITFYSQGDWSVERLWDAVSHLVSNVIQTNDPSKPVSHTGGKIHMLLVLPALDRHLMEAVLRYKQHVWFDKLTVICHTSSLSFQQHADYVQQLNAVSPEASVEIVIGKKAAAQQSLWLRWDDKTLQTIFVSGPMFTTKIGNPPFATYTSTFIDSASSHHNTLTSSHLTMITDVWRDMIGHDL